MILSLITLAAMAVLFAIMGIVILIGKGDNLIAGYNTASKEERAKYDIKRLRGLIGGLLLGVIEILGKAYISTELGDAIVFAVLIIVLLVKPSGLFGKPVREKV